MRGDQVDDLLEQVEILEDRLEKTERALAAKDRELSKARAGYALVAKHNAEIEAEHEETFDKLTTAERERDEAMAALREKEERVKALEAEVARVKTDRQFIIGFNDGWDEAIKQNLRFPAMLRKMWSGQEVQRWIDDEMARARSVQPVSGSREQRGNEAALVSGSREDGDG